METRSQSASPEAGKKDIAIQATPVSVYMQSGNKTGFYRIYILFLTPVFVNVLSKPLVDTK